MADEEEGIPSTGQRLSNELMWETLSQEASEANLSGRLSEAVHLWRRTGNVVLDFAESDPRRPSTISNTGIAHLRCGDKYAAETAFRKAIAGWLVARQWVENMTVSGTAKNSLFHLRLEVKHHHSFQKHIRAQYQDLLDGAEASSRFNLAALLLTLGKNDEGLELMKDAIKVRERVFGATNPELTWFLRIMDRFSTSDEVTDSAVTSDYLKRAHHGEGDPSRTNLERWHSDRPQKMNDARRVISAMCFTDILTDLDIQ